MKYYAIVGIFESILKLTVAFICVYTTLDKLIVYGILMACIPLITLGIMRIYCHRHYEECEIAPRTYWNKKLMNDMASFAGWNFISSLSTVIGYHGIGIVLNHFFGAIANAAQGVVNQFSGQLGAFGNIMKKAINPVITKSAGAHDDKMLIQATVTGTKMTFFATTIMFVPIMVDPQSILMIWLKNPPQYTEIFCVLVLATNMTKYLTIYIPQSINSVGNIKKYSQICCILGLLPIILSYILFNWGFPPYTMYFTTIFAAIGRVVTDLYFGQILCGISYKYFFREVILKLLICVVISYSFGYIIKLLLIISLWRFVIIVLITISIYATGFYVIALNKKEKTIIQGLIVKAFSKIRKQ